MSASAYPGQLVAVLHQHRLGLVVLLVDDPMDLAVDVASGLLGVALAVRISRPRKTSPSFFPKASGPSFSLMPHSQTMARARSVARSMSLPGTGGALVEREHLGQRPPIRIAMSLSATAGRG